MQRNGGIQIDEVLAAEIFHSLRHVLFHHFDLAGIPGTPEFIFQYGFWGSIISALEDPAVCSPNLPTLTGTESVAAVIHHCPKYRALLEQAPH